MIVARIYKAKGGDSTAGSVGIEGYPIDEGWFPANSFNFGFKGKKEEKTDTGGRGSTGGGQSAGAGATASARVQTSSSSSDSGQDKEVFSKMSLSKEVDNATCSLMALAMEERKSKKGVDSGIRADVHVLSSVNIGSKRFIYASLMMHLEGVRVEDWHVDGSGDERPSEGVQLGYDRAAMAYQKTPDGKRIEPLQMKAWDQDKGGPWEYKFESKYLDKP
jgi:type VI protein secretion system component Hcp